MVEALQTIVHNNSVLPYTQPSSKAAQTAPSPKTSDNTNVHAAKAVVQDKVTISAVAQARQMLEQGRSVSQIAAALSITQAAVDSYLGITSAATTNVSQIPAATHPISLPTNSSAGLSTQQPLSLVA